MSAPGFDFVSSSDAFLQEHRLVVGLNGLLRSAFSRLMSRMDFSSVGRRTDRRGSGITLLPVRRDQSPARANAGKIEWDARFGLVKLNPLGSWNWKDLWQYIKANDVDYNPLHDQNYPSIGCTHCTRPVLPGEDPRAGRWSGTAKTECGLHVQN